MCLIYYVYSTRFRKGTINVCVIDNHVPSWRQMSEPLLAGIGWIMAGLYSV